MANRFSVIPGKGYGDLLTKFGGRLERSEEISRGREAETARQDYIANMKAESAEAYASGNIDQMIQVGLKYPEISKTMETVMQHKSEQTSQNYQDALFDMYVDPSEQNVKDIISARQGMLAEEAADSTETDMFLDKFREDPEGVRSQIEQELAFRYPNKMKRLLEMTKTESESEIKVGSQEILEDGTLIQSTPTGPVVYNPEGELVTGRDAANAVKVARAQKVSNLREAAGEKKRASLEAEEELKGKVEAGVISQKEAAKISVKAFDRLEKINININNIDEAIRLIDEGAETGVIMSKLPSVRAASIKLNNLQGRLGLDVLGSTTFGALSEAELKFALSTALPQNLQGPDLKIWLQNKKAAQEKLSDYIEASAIFLGTPGNTVKDWIVKQREKQEIETPAYTGGQTAPQTALDYLSANPGAAEQFKTKYGYLPEGF